MKKFTTPEIKVTYFVTEDVALDLLGLESATDPTNILDTEEKKVQVGSINFETLK
ncbi:MAG: hypothetical protein KIG65_03085 [Eubacteriales bacterium]|nr:hypothetical protein [Eubacteriales bacterium]